MVKRCYYLVHQWSTEDVSVAQLIHHMKINVENEKFMLQRSQDSYKRWFDQNRKLREFKEGDMVYLWL